MTYVYIILGLVIAYFVACYICFSIAIVRSKEPDYFSDAIIKSGPWANYLDIFYSMRKWIITRTFSHVYLESHDGLTLHGRLLMNNEPRGTMILFHGYRSEALHDMGAGADFYYNLGFNLLFVDQRSHQNSQGKFICFGVKERFDCRDWCLWVTNNISCTDPIILGGLSMGATTVMMACDTDLPDNVSCVIADCGFTSPKAIIGKVSSRMHLPFNLFYPGINLWCNILAKFGLNDASTLDSLSNTSLPFMFIHGTGDKFVPIEMTYDNYHSCSGPKELLAVPGATHGASFLVNPDLYKTHVKAFINKYVK